MLAPQRSLAPGQPPRNSFASFVYGPESLLAYRAAFAAAERPAEVYNPLYIQSTPGMGKTHLLKAIAQHLGQRSDMHNVIYVPAETLSQELTTSIRQRRSDAFRDRYRAAGALLIDDLPVLAGRTAVLEDLTYTIDALRESGRQVVVSGEGDPSMLKGLPDRLRSRLTSGLVVRIGKPSLRTRLALAKTFAGYTQAWFTAEALHLLAHRTAGGVNELETAVRRCAHIAPQGGMVGATIVRSVLCDLLRQAQNAPVRGDVDTILKAVCAEFGVSKDDLLSKKREATISQARQITMYLLREDAGLTVARIGRELERDHSTVLHGCKRIESSIVSTDDSIVSAISAVRENLLDSLA
ncbi:MAG TPA: DnaA/Hda family protein [Chloroflexota bacterium]|jgi:chromosomal replication initiator protein